MPNLNWFAAVITYTLESSIEVVIIYLVVQAALRAEDLNKPSAKSRFLLLPLIIPVLFSPVLHLFFPPLEQFAIIVQIERVLPVLGIIRSDEGLFPSLLIAMFALLFFYNALTGLAVSLRGICKASQTERSAHIRWQKLLGRLAQGFSVSRPILTISTRHPTCAYVFGWRRPIVTLGSAWLDVLDPEEMEAVFAHELAHFSRGDNWLLLIAKTCRDLMLFNPLANSIYHQYVEAREAAADDCALQVTRNPLALASSLLKFWRRHQAVVSAPLAAGFAAHPDQLERRIRRLCNNYRWSSETTPASNGLFYGLSIALTIALSLI